MKFNTLNAKLLLPFGGLIGLSLLISGIMFEIGTQRTSRELLEAQLNNDLEGLISSLMARIDAVDSAALILSANPEVIDALKNDGTSDLSAGLEIVNGRAVLVRDRFELDLVQIYNSYGLARTNLVQSSLYQVTSLLDDTGSLFSGVMEIEGRLVYLSSHPIKQGAGTVIVGIDVESELQRLMVKQNLVGDLQVKQSTAEFVADLQTYTQMSDGAVQGQKAVQVSSTWLVTTLTRNTREITDVVDTGRNVMLSSLVVMAVLILLLANFVIRYVTRPARELAQAAQELAAGNFEQATAMMAALSQTRNPFRIGIDDEFGQLADNFNHMAFELEGMYSKLIKDLQYSYQELNRAYDATLHGWASALELRDHETEHHTFRTAHMTVDLARVMGIAEEEIVHIRRGAMLHDIGKLAIPDHILRKPGRLSEDEWSIMTQHPLYAYVMLRPIDYLAKAIDIPYCHHERWDGSGYPRGLKEEEIPLGARIFMVVDVWDAMQSDRPYRPAVEREQVIEYIEENAGILFDPNVVEAFINWIQTEQQIEIGSVPE